MGSGFSFRIKPIDPAGAYREADAWIWCGSVIRGDDDRYHMFASRWSKQAPFNPYWLTNSRVVRAVADRPEGPYRYVEDVLPPRGEEFWDGRMTHNPTIHRCGDRFLLFYTGTTYEGPTPDANHRPVWGDPQLAAAHTGQRIGLAHAPSVTGPWTRADRPILSPRPGRWDALLVSNPAAAVEPNGRTLLLYKAVARAGGPMRFGLAEATHWREPFARAAGEPVFPEHGPALEDGYLWEQNGRFHLLAKDLEGAIADEPGALVHLDADDPRDWRVERAVAACSKTLPTQAGEARRFSAAERPQLLFDADDRPTHLFLAVAQGRRDSFVDADETFSVCVPLQ